MDPALFKLKRNKFGLRYYNYFLAHKNNFREIPRISNLTSRMAETNEIKEDTREKQEPAVASTTEAVKIEQLSLAEGNGGSGDEPLPKNEKQKIDVLLKATGNAPIMKKKKWTVDQEKKIGGVIEFIKKYLRLEPSENLFLYVNQAFAPSPDQTIKNLYECFGADGKLVLHYCKSQAWG